MKSFEENGYWWLPGYSKNVLAGKLKFNPIDGAKLELSGVFNKKNIVSGITDDNNRDWNIILGVISGKKVTLHKCHEFSSSFSVPGFTISHLNVTYIFIGHHFSKEEDIKFDNISISYSNLNEWVGRTGFTLKPIYENGGFSKYECTFQPPKAIGIDLDELKIVITYLFSATQDIFNPEFSQTTVLELNLKDNLSFEDYNNNILYYIQCFLSLGVGEAVYPSQIKGENKEYKSESPRGENKEIEIYYVMNRSDLKEQHINNVDMFFSLGDIEDNLEECLDNWFEKADRLNPTYNLYFANLYNPPSYLELNFLSLAQAIESYHRRMYGGEYMKGDEYEEVYDKLTKSIPEDVGKDHKQSLSNKIFYGNELSFRTRLKRIFSNIGENIYSPIIENKAYFINEIVDMRNYLTHYDKNLDGKVNKTDNLFLLTQKLKFIMEVCFLLELGLSGDKIEELTSKDNRYDDINGYKFQ